MKLGIIFQWLVVLVMYSCSAPSGGGTNGNGLMKASFSVQTNDPRVNQPIQFKNSSTVPSAKNVSYQWDFGDGGTSSEKAPSHTYTQLGNYEVKLTVVFDGGSKTAIQAIAVGLSHDIAGRKALSEHLDFLKKENKIMISAHRANHENAPENSLLAIQHAMDAAIGMVEIDIRSTKDGVLVLMHDDKIDRTTDGTGKVSDYTYEQLQKFRLKNNHAILADVGEVTTEKIPTLKEVFELARGKIYLNLDIDDKKASPQPVYQLANLYGMLKQVMFFSSSSSDIRTLYGYNASIIAMPTVYRLSVFEEYKKSGLNLSIVHFNLNSSSPFDRTLVDKATEEGWSMFNNAYILTSKLPRSDDYQQIKNIIQIHGNVIQTDFLTETKNYLIHQNLY